MSGKTPSSRSDDYPQAILRKLREVYERAKFRGSDFVVCGGDLFNTHRIFSYEVLNDLMDVIESSSLHTYIVIGQHDLVGYNQESYKSSTLAFVINRCRNISVIWEPTKVGDITLHPSHVWEDLMNETHDTSSDSIHILVAHHLLTNKKTLFDFVNTSDFKNKMQEIGCQFDMVLSGDLHDGYDVHQVDGTWFCNPGSLGRQSTHALHRHPKYVVIDAKHGEVPVIDQIDVECAESDVFRESVHEMLQKTSPQFDANAFVAEIQSFESEAVDVRDLVHKMAHSSGLRNEVLEYLLSKASNS